MIGSALAMHYYGKKNWTKSLIFWAAMLVGGLILAAVLKTGGSVIIGAAMFIYAAHSWYKFSWTNSVVIYAISFVLDVVILMVLGLTALGLIIGLTN
jgi:chromate transport protein ChrA